MGTKRSARSSQPHGAASMHTAITDKEKSAVKNAHMVIWFRDVPAKAVRNSGPAKAVRTMTRSSELRHMGSILTGS
ncbi:hypothetical protein KC332_g13894 [Hortaea werneckii]|nr:hypothetical protein KC332_g13894 [Hortaea werneckii]